MVEGNCTTGREFVTALAVQEAAFLAAVQGSGGRGAGPSWLPARVHFRAPAVGWLGFEREQAGPSPYGALVC